MPKDTRDKNVLTTLAAILITITVLIGFVAVILQQTNQKKQADIALVNASNQKEPAMSTSTNPEENLPAVNFNKPQEMRGVFVKPGADFLTELSYQLKQAEKAETQPASWQTPQENIELSVNEEQAKMEIEKMFSRAKDLGMNTIFVKTNTLLGTIYNVDAIHALTSNYDAMEEICKQAKENEVYLYAVYDISLLPNGDEIKRFTSIDNSAIQTAIQPLEEFAKKYSVDGILLDGCQNNCDSKAYNKYAMMGSGIGFTNYMQSNTSALITVAASAIRRANPAIQVGLSAEASADIELSTHFADTREIVESGLLDFVGVTTNYAAGTEDQLFETTLTWWNSLCGATNLPGYVIHAADKAVTWQDGWGAKSQLADQFNAVKSCENLNGSVFNSLKSLRNNPNGTATALTKAFEDADSTEADSRQNSQQDLAENNNNTQKEPVAFVQANETFFGKTETFAKKLAVKKKKKPANSNNSNSSTSGTTNDSIQSGTLVKVVAEQAITFPAKNSSIYPDDDCYPLPQGTMDYVTGDQVVTKVTSSSGTEYRKYYKLRSGRRVYIEDVKAASGAGLDGNRITGLTVKANNDYTYVIVKSDMPVSFLPEYTDRNFSIDFQYTNSTPGDLNLSKNPLFSYAEWSGSKLVLDFKTRGGFLGYKAYNENGNIVFRFNNPRSISNARIVVDPGHGGSDPGAERGLRKDYPEKQVNWELSQAIKRALEAKGANVLLLQTVNRTTSMDERLAQARNFNAQLYLSIHTNSTESNTTAVGSESYYFFPFAKALANELVEATSTGLNTNNRGTKFDVFYVTRDPQFVGILSECGFLTTSYEYAKLMDSGYQADVGKQMATAIEAHLENAGARYYGITGTESVGIASDASDGPTSSGSSSPENSTNNSNNASGVTSLILDRKEMDLSLGGERRLNVTLRGNTNAPISFSSSDTSVARVDSQGYITGRSRGEADISVIAGDQKGVCRVYVDGFNGTSTGTESNTGVNKPVTGVRIRSTTTTLSVGESTRLIADIMPGDATNQRVTWDISSGEDKLSITQDGTITGLKRGNASVHISTEDGYYSHEIDIKVR